MSNRDDQRPLSVEEVLELQDGDWVNGGFQAVVLTIEAKNLKQNRKGWSLTLGSETGNATLSMLVFQAPRYSIGALIEVGGTGIKFKYYNGAPEVSLGRSSTVNMIRAGTASGAQVREQNNRPPAPPDRSDSNNPPPPTDAGHTATPPDAAEKAALAMIPGPTVGHAMTHALELVKEAWMQPVVDKNAAQLRDVLNQGNFWLDVWNVASDIIRISNSLQKGKIRPTLRDRLNPPKEEVPPPPPPPAAKPAKKPAKKPIDNDEDVPF